MTGFTELDLILSLLAAVAATVVAAAESALEAASRSRLEALAQEGNARAAVCLSMKEDDEKFHAAARISVTFLLAMSAILVVPTIDLLTVLWIQPFVDPSLFAAAHLALFALAAAILSGLFVALCWLYAPALGRRYADAFSLKAVPFMRLLVRLSGGARASLTFIANLPLRPAADKATFGEPVISEESLMDLIEEGAESGILDKTEHELIESILEFTDTTAREIMIPRKDIVAIDCDLSAEMILDAVLREGFTRMPVYRGSIDNVIGVIYSKDVLNLVEHKNLIILEDIIRPPFIVPESKPISELLREFQRKRIHLAVVADEFGGTQGIITLEDILEEIVGEIRDEYDEETPQFELFPEGAVEAEGRMNISSFNNQVPIVIPESDEYDTIGGFVTSLMGKIPEIGDAVMFQNFRIVVLDAGERRVGRVRMTPVQAEE
jgi:CBS domain containing-hemolysin-like protein